MSVEDNKGLLEKLPDFISKAIRSGIEAEFDEQLKKFTDRMKERREEVVAAVLISAMRTVEVNTMTDRITFTIHKDAR
jgi:hypothetical protein